jgi:hypothetical protein
MESTIDFFRFREREDFIAVSPGRGSVAMLSPRTASVNYFMAQSSQLDRFSLVVQAAGLRRLSTLKVGLESTRRPVRAEDYSKPFCLVDGDQRQGLIPEGELD